MILNRTRVEMIQNIDVSNIGWCNEAVIFHVINGKGSFTHRISEEDDEYDFYSQLLLNGKPIIQSEISNLSYLFRNVSNRIWNRKYRFT